MDQDWLNEIKRKHKKYPRLYKFIIDYLSPVKGNSRKGFKIVFETMPPGPKLTTLNLGSGPFKLDDQMINIDTSRYPNVHVQADIHHLPFKDNTVDAIFNIAVLEHVKDPAAVIKESKRVLKKDGLIYSLIPFIVGFHASPEDYHRVTLEGMKYLHREFDLIEAGVAGGPTSGVLWVMQEWLAMLLSFGSTKLYKILYIIIVAVTWPVKYADVLLVRHPMAKNIASSFYVLGRK